jgi:anti-anti-sigma factor
VHHASSVAASTQLRFDTSSPLPSTTRVAVFGEVEITTAHLCRDRLLDILRERAPAVLDIDFAGVSFLDCTGISALVCVHNAAVEAGCRMWVSDPQPLVRRVLDVTGLLGVFAAPLDRPPPATRERPS